MLMQQAGQGVTGYGSAQGAVPNTIAPPTPQTLNRALSTLEDLNKRLAQLTSGIQSIAQQIGGPFPVRGDNPAKDGPPQSAMESLNSKIDGAHAWVADIEGAQEAIRRSLGS